MKRDRKSVEARQARILSMVREQQSVHVDELAGHFGVSLMTIRRDLQILEQNGMLSRFHGGASVEPAAVPGAEQEEAALYRRLISRFAATLVRSGDRLFINGSRTALDVLDYVDVSPVSVFTNNGLAIGRPVAPGVEVTIAGGNLRGNGHIMTGDCTMRNLLMMEADKALLGCSGISPEGEILCGISTELGINETMISHAKHYYVLADHTKIGKTGLFSSFFLESTGTIITDEKAPETVLERLRDLGMEVIRVAKSDFPDLQERV